MSSIGPAVLDRRRESDGVFVLDIRPREEYEESHIRGSCNAPVYRDLKEGDTTALDDHLESLPQNAEVVTVCRAGIVARKATAHLESAGYEARTLRGGYFGWRQFERNTRLYRVLSWLQRHFG